MKAAVDSSVLIDVLLPDPQYQVASLQLLEHYAARGALVICPVVYAETAAVFSPTSDFSAIARQMGLSYDNLSPAVAELSAQMWHNYRRRGGPRRRVLPDFLIGAHAHLCADVLLARDRGYFREYFQGLRVEYPD